MRNRVKLILWDVALLIGIVLFIIVNDTQHYDLIIGFSTVLILTNCITNHIAAYKLNGKLY